MAAPTNVTPTAEQRIAIGRAVDRLAADYEGVFNRETIDRYVMEAFPAFADTTSARYLEHVLTQLGHTRLYAVGKLEGLIETGKPMILFLCIHNAGRSQMALGFARYLAGRNVDAFSGGSMPSADLNELVIEAMRERGIDITMEFPKPWSDDIVKAADVVITMGCGDACPIFPGKRYEDWPIPDPAGQRMDAVRAIRDEVEARVRALLTSLDVELVRP
jgi:protein-tyrosine-phosphatase